MSNRYYSRRRVLAGATLGLTSGCLRLESSKVETPEKSTTEDITKEGSTEHATTTEQHGSQLLSENWTVDVEDRGYGRYLHLTDSYAILSGDGIHALNHSDGSKAYHAFQNIDGNQTSAMLDPPFVSFGDHVFARARGPESGPHSLLSVGPDGSDTIKREVSVFPQAQVKFEGSILVHFPKMREHEVSAGAATAYCSVGGGELKTITQSLKTTNSLSLPENMCSAGIQVATPEYYIVKTDPYVRVISRETEDELWKKPLEAVYMNTWGSTLYLSTLNHGVVGLNISTGKKVWQLGQSLSTLYKHDGVLYGTGLDTIAIDLTDNQILWREKRRGHPLGQPKIINGTLIVVTDQYVYGYNPDDGTIEYQSPLPASVQEMNSPRVRIHSSGLYVKSESSLRQFVLHRV